MREFFLLLCISIFLLSCTKDKQRVTIYVSEDQVFSEPVLKAFEKESGIKVNAIYDTEESKSTGVMNRLIAEKNNPQADVYWANEPIRAEVLKQKGILSPYKSINTEGISQNFLEPSYYWSGFSARVRLLIAQKNLLNKPSSIFDYTKAIYKGRTVIANPLFGSTTAHISALFTYLGDEKGKKFLKALKQNSVALSTSNGESADFVTSKSYLFALVDSDDAFSRYKQNKDIQIIYPDQKSDEMGLFVIPNAIMLIKGAPHKEKAKKLIDFLLSKKSEEMLAFADCAQIPLHKGVPTPKIIKPLETLKIMPLNYEKIAKKMLQIQPYLQKWLQKNE